MTSRAVAAPAVAVSSATTISATAGRHTLQRKCSCGNLTSGSAICDSCADKKKLLRRKPNASGNAIAAENVAPPIVDDVLRSPGRPLEQATRGLMESRFGRDFSHIRVHTDPRAADSARAVNALAYTVGSNVVFANGQYAPTTTAGQRLLAHELTHTLQQGYTPANSQPLTISEGSEPSEREADHIADVIVAGHHAQPDHISAAQVQRDAAPHSAEATATEPGVSEAYDGCGSYREQVGHARVEAEQAVTGAITLLDGQHNEQAAPLLLAHFHLDITNPDNASDVQRVRSQFVRMQQALGSNVRIFCRSAPMPGTGAARPTMPVSERCRGSGRSILLAESTSCAAGDSSATVTLCEMAILESVHPLKKTLIHEFAHIACNGDPPIRSGGASGNEAYYEGDRLPGSETNILVNADSYAGFALAAEHAVGAASTSTAASSNDHTGWGVLTVLGGLATVAGTIGLAYGASQGNTAALGLGIAGLGAGAASLGVGIAGLAGAFDSRPSTREASSGAGGRASTDAGRMRTPSELAGLSAWELAQLPESAFAAGAGAETSADSGGATMADYARAWRVVRCIRDFDHVTVDPERTGQLGRDPTASEWPMLRQTLSQILAHANVGALVSGPDGRGDLGAQPLANKVRVLDRLQWGIKRFQLESLISTIGAGADRLVRLWWAESRCSITPGATPHILDQERRMAVFHEKVMESGLGSGGFYFPPDDTIYIGESMMMLLSGGGVEGENARQIAGHEMVHFLGGRERTRRAFIDYFHDDHWICYWSAYEEGMAELTTRDALAGGQSGADRSYGESVALMRDIMRALGEERVRRAYFTGAPDREIFESLRQGLPSHSDPSLPPICRAPAVADGGTPR